MLRDMEAGNPLMHQRNRGKLGTGASRAATAPLAMQRNDDDDGDDSSNNKKRAAAQPKIVLSRRAMLLIGGIAGAIGIALYAAARSLSRLVFLRVLTMLPAMMSLYTGLRTGQTLQRRIIPLALVVTVVTAQLPSYIGVGLAAAGIVSFSVATIPDDKGPQSGLALDGQKGKVGFATVVVASLGMVTVLLTENFLIWVVSATFEAGQDVATAPPPLQDNGQLFLQHVLLMLSKQQVVGLRRLWNTQSSLVACLGASFVVVELFHPVRTLYSLATRLVMTVSVARSIRTISFLLTVMPSQVSNCYAQRFPVPPPTDWMEWIWVGVMPRTHGGCNDLIISGHATITSSSTLIFFRGGSNVRHHDF